MKYLFTLVFLTLFYCTSANSMENGEDLFNKCKTVYLSEDEASEPANALGYMNCAGYLRGVVDSNSFYEYLLQGNSTLYKAGSVVPFMCNGSSVSTETLMKIVVKYLLMNPSSMKESAMFVIVDSLGTEYQCK